MRKLAPYLLFLTAILAGCAAPRPASHDFCQSGTVLLDAHFDGGQLGNCAVSGNGVFDLTLFPEDAPPINKSPWYAYRVSGQRGDDVIIRMQFHEDYGYARYWPKYSRDGSSWQPLPPEQVSVSAEGDSVEVSFELDQARIWIAGQEVLAQAYYRQWINELEFHHDVETRLIGHSVQGRPLYLAETADRPEFILLIGRQHPPEVTGAIAMRSFIDTILADTDLARKFRARFKLAIVPLVNPDGVAGGHWRHNVNGVDVNRDWGPFTQPESQSVVRWVERHEANGEKLRLMLDFHSTFENLFYTQPVSDDPVDFASLWLGASAPRLPDFTFKHEANEVSEQPNSKNYYYTSRGIPAITYESGDETNREQIEHAAVVFAEEMMRIMLDSDRD